MVSTALVWGHHLPPNTGIESRIQIMSRHYFTMILKCMSCMLLCLVSQHVWLFWDPMDCGPPGSSVHGILQARRVEWVAFPLPGNLPDPGIEPTSPVLQVDSLPLSHWGRPWIFYKVLIQFKRKKKKNYLGQHTRIKETLFTLSFLLSLSCTPYFSLLA